MAYPKPDPEELGADESNQEGTPRGKWEGPIWELTADYDGKILEWFVKGPLPQWVEQDDALYLAIDYAPPFGDRIITLPSPCNGYLLRIFVREGEEVRREMPVCEILVHSVRL